MFMFAPAPLLWYENAQGKRWIPTQDQINRVVPPPPEFKYQWSRFPRVLHDECCTTEGVVMRGSASWPGDLVLAMVRPTWRERLIAILRYGTWGSRYSIEQAILRATGCAHCINTLAHRYGLSWGYRAGSPQDDSGTSCEHCQPIG